MDAGLLQIEIAKIIGACENSIVSWELGKTYPTIKYIPQIIDFLGYLPFSESDDVLLGEQMITYRQIHGISQEELAQQLYVNPDTIWRWENGISQPSIINNLALSLTIDRPISEKLCRFRKLSGLTQQELAQQLGVARCTLGKWERGVGHPPEHIIEKVDTLLATEFCKHSE